MSEHLFIFGAPRSGTTFLASLLKETPFGAPFETQFIIKYFHRLANYGDLNIVENLSRLVADVSQERAVMQWGVKLDAAAILSEMGGQFDYARFVDIVCGDAARLMGSVYWGDKTPAYLQEPEVIIDLFPDAKFLYIIRDGRDVALSLLEKIWGPGNTYACAEYWDRLNSPNTSLQKLQEEGKLFVLRYEDLLDDCSKLARKIYDFVGYEADDVLIEKHAANVIPGNYDKWRIKMSRNQVKVFESVAGETLERFGYECVYGTGEIGFFRRSIYRLHNLYLRCWHLFVINVVDGIKIRFFGKQPFAD